MEKHSDQNNINPEHRRYSEDSFGEMNKLLEQAIKNKDYDTWRKQAKASLEKLNDELLNDSRDFLTNTERGSESEIFFRTLAEEIPDLGVSIDEKALSPDGKQLKNYIAIKTVPLKTDRQFIQDLKENPVISLYLHRLAVRSKTEKEELGINLEKMGLLPKGITERLLCRWHKKDMKEHPDIKKIWEENKSRFENIKPLSDEEIKEFMRKTIRDEYNKKI